jgi:hypothetical protein
MDSVELERGAGTAVLAGALTVLESFTASFAADAVMLGKAGACQVLCVSDRNLLVQVCVEAFGVGDGQVAQGLGPAGGGGSLDEVVPG